MGTLPSLRSRPHKLPSMSGDEEKGLLNNAVDPAAAEGPTDDFSSHVPVFYEWRDSIFGCFNNCMPSCMMATFCGPCFVAQMYEKEIGTAGPLGVNGTCQNITAFFIILVFVTGLFGAGASHSSFSAGMNNVLQTLEWLCLGLVIFFTRQAIRKKYAIKPMEGLICTQPISGMKEKALIEDILCSFCCDCCAIAQMARHIYDYDNTSMQCRFNATGDVGDAVPVTIPGPALQLRNELGYIATVVEATPVSEYSAPAAPASVSSPPPPTPDETAK